MTPFHPSDQRRRIFLDISDNYCANLTLFRIYSSSGGIVKEAAERQLKEMEEKYYFYTIEESSVHDEFNCKKIIEGLKSGKIKPIKQTLENNLSIKNKFKNEEVVNK